MKRCHHTIHFAKCRLHIMLPNACYYYLPTYLSLAIWQDSPESGSLATFYEEDTSLFFTGSLKIFWMPYLVWKSTEEHGPGPCPHLAAPSPIRSMRLISSYYFNVTCFQYLQGTKSAGYICLEVTRFNTPRLGYVC